MLMVLFTIVQLASVYFALNNFVLQMLLKKQR